MPKPIIKMRKELQQSPFFSPLLLIWVVDRVVFGVVILEAEVLAGTKWLLEFKSLLVLISKVSSSISFSSTDHSVDSVSVSCSFVVCSRPQLLRNLFNVFFCNAVSGRSYVAEIVGSFSTSLWFNKLTFLGF